MVKNLFKTKTNDDNFRSFIIIFSSVMILSLLGFLMNSLVMFSNDGRMPVYAGGELNSPTYFTFQHKEEVNFWYLSDIFYTDGKIFSIMFNYLPGSLIRGKVVDKGLFSIGDYFIAIGFYSALFTYIAVIIFGIKNRKDLK